MKKPTPDPHTGTYLVRKEFRMTPEEKELSERAAKRAKKTWNSFAREALAKAVKATLGALR